MELNSDIESNLGTESVVEEPTTTLGGYPQPIPKVEELVAIETGSGLKITMGSCLIPCNELAILVLEMKNKLEETKETKSKINMVG